MGWTGKVLGGLFGGIVGGPVGMAAGAALGHWFADSDDAEPAGERPLELDRLDWQHHAFRPTGPGMVLVPVWTARGLDGTDVQVRVRVLGTTWRATVTVEADPETCALPEVFVPYASLGEVEGGSVIVEVRLAGADGVADRARYPVALPTPVRRLGGSGPARVVMALVACARAGGRTLTRDDVRFIRTRFEEAYPLEEAGSVWLRAWLRELRAADLDRLTPEKVAERLGRHVDTAGAEGVVEWLLAGARACWPGDGPEAYAEALAAALGVDSAPIRSRVEASAIELTRGGAAGVLGVAVDADAETVRAAWKRLVQAAHPDVNPGDSEGANRRTARLNRAYQVMKG